MDPFTSTKPLFSCRNITFGTHGSLCADICVPNFLRNRHHWALLRAPNHCFPAGICHLAHMSPHRPTFMCPNPLGTAASGAFHEHQPIVSLHEYYTWHTRLPMNRHLWSKLRRMTPHIHTSSVGNVDLGYTRAIRSCISMHTCSHVSMHPGLQLSITLG